MASLGEEFPIEQARARKLLGQYKDIGPAGSFGAAMIEQCLQQADQAVISGDPVAMLIAYESLKKLE